MVDFNSQKRSGIESEIIAEESVMGPRTPTEMDRLVGQRIRLARKMAKLSQTQLGQIVGLSNLLSGNSAESGSCILAFPLDVGLCV